MTVTCSINTSSIEGGDTLGPGPESQTLCRLLRKDQKVK